MAEKKKFLLRIDDETYKALEKWAADELRSINGQIEFILKDSLKKNNRIKETIPPNDTTNENDPGK